MKFLQIFPSIFLSEAFDHMKNDFEFEKEHQCFPL